MTGGVRPGLIALALLAASSATAQTRAVQATPTPVPMARCEVGNSNAETYKGPCVFTLGAHGSFSVARPGNARIIEDYVIILVEVIRPGVATVTGRTRAGVTINLGRATRGENGSACWRNADLWVCVYG